MKDVDDHNNVSLNIFKLPIDNEDFFIILDEMVSLVCFCADRTLGFLLNLIQEGLLLFVKVSNNLVVQ